MGSLANVIKDTVLRKVTHLYFLSPQHEASVQLIYNEATFPSRYLSLQDKTNGLLTNNVSRESTRVK